MNEQEIFLQALALPPDARSVYLEHACADDPALKAAVAALLRAHLSASAFLENPAVDPDLTVVHGSTEIQIGERIGPYKLVELVGEGGMGSVYLAQQTEPVKRAVAIKVIKAGMDSKAVLARFEAERQALAMMDHPNIAKVLDAGATVGGRPYFVMELVKGLPITKFCDERRLTLRQRLELFVPVCQAIQHAHQKGVIHRDLKPSNVLVALYDDHPVPKVIDFGVAKAAGQSLTDLTLLTGIGAVVGTIEYMSPEQASLNNLDVDTRSDVYSLGVLLYELLTGSTPMDRKSLGSAALMEILRIVREVDVPPPSVKLSTADTLPSVAANRSIEPAKLSKLMKGELDWVLLKALEKDRTRRYETANAFARDLQRYLSDELVEARPPSAAYRLTKFVRRNKGQVLAASLIVLALVGGVIGTSWGMLNAQAAQEREGERAEGEKKANEQSKKRLIQIEKGIELFANIVKDLNPNNEKAGGLPIYEQLLERAETAADGLEAEAVGDTVTLARLQLELGRTIQQLGNPKKAAVLLEKAHATLRRERGADGAESLAAAHALALAWIDCGGPKVDDAIRFLTRLRDDRAAKLGPEDPDTLDAANSLALALDASGRGRQALELYESIREPLVRRLGEDHELTLRVLRSTAVLYDWRGRVDDSIKLFEHVRGLEAKKFGARSLNVCRTSVELAHAHQSAGDWEAALRVLEEVVDALRTKLPHHSFTMEAMNGLAVAYTSAARFGQSIPLLEELMRRAEAKSGRRDYQTITAMINLGVNYTEVGRTAKAIRLLEESLGATPDRLLRRHAGAALANAYAKAGQRREVRLLVDKLAYDCRRDFPEGDLQRAQWLHRLGKALLDAKAPFEAETLLREAFAIRVAKEPQAWTTFSTQALLGAVRFRRGNPTEDGLPNAETLLRKGFEGMKARLAKIPPRERTQLFETAEALASLYKGSEKPDVAARWEKEAEALKPVGWVDAAKPTTNSYGLPMVGFAAPTHPTFLEFVALVRPVLALVSKRTTAPRPTGKVLGTAAVVFQEMTFMRGYRIVGLLALAAASVQAPDAAAQYAFSLIDVPGSTATSAHDINAAGHIVGNFKDASGLSKPYLLRGGVFTVLDLPGSTFGNGNAINSVGQIAGRWDDAAGVTHGFLWESGVLTMIDAQGVGATKTNVMAINDKGQMAGKYWDQNGIAHGCVLDRTGAVLWNDFDVPGAISTEPKGINEAGDLVGTYALPDGTMYGFRKLRGGALEYPWGYPGTGSPLPQTVEDIDDAGAIVVNYFDGQHRGALLKDGAWTLVDVPGAVDTSLDAFSGPNGTGVFVGTCYLNGVHHGFKTITPKFLTADDVLATGGDAVYQYDGSGLGAVPQPLYSYNSATRGMTRNAAGTQYWTINADRMVYVYDANFQPVDFWAANGLPTACQVGGIATAGNDVWVLDAKSLKVLKFTNGALDTNGDKSASGSFKLAAANSKPKDIVTDGTYFWVLDDAATDKVYKYTMTGTFVSSFTLSTAGATAPRAIAIDPANPNDLWIVDGGTKRVYKYANAVNAANSSSQTAASSFPLAAGNTNPQGLILKP